MEMGANNSWFPPILQYTNTSISVNLPPVNFLFYQVHLKEPHSSFSPSCQGKENQGRKSKEKKKVADNGVTHSGPISFLPGCFWPETPLQRTREFSPLFWGPLSYPHQASDICALRGKGMPSHPSYNHSRGAQPSHGHVTGRDSAGHENSSIFPLQPSELKRNRVTKWGLEQIYLPPSGQLPSLWNGVATKRYHIQHAWDMATK